MDKERLHKVYEMFMISLALLVVAMLVIEFTVDLEESTSNVLSVMDTSILVIFAIDYFTRLFIATDRKEFVRTNKADLIAIIPFSSVFRVFRIARLARLARLSRINRLVRAGVWIARYREKFSLFINTNGFIYMVIITVTMILAGAVGIYFFEDMSFIDGIWWAFVTATTVGYGDISPESFGGRVVAGILMLIGIGFIGMLTGTIATYFLGGKGKEKPYKQEVIEGIKGKLDTFDSLSHDEVEDIIEVLRGLKKRGL